MIALKVYPDGLAEIKNVDPSDFYDEVGGAPEEYRPFVDTTLVMVINSEAGVREGRNVAVPFMYLCGTVLFVRTKGKGQSYVDLDEEKIESLCKRFPKIKLKEEEKCETLLSLRERFVAWLTRILMVNQ